MRVLACGSRTWDDVGAIRAFFLLLPPGTVIIHGGAKGADKLAGEVAKELHFAVEVFQADWSKYGKQAGILRNIAMLDTKPDLVIAFWDGKSRGTAHTIAQAKKNHIPVEIYGDES